MTIHLSIELEQFVHDAIRAGRYASEDEVFHDALDRLRGQTLKERWEAAGMDQRAMCVRAAKRFCRIAYQMVAGGQVFRHPSCQKRDAILHKLTCFYVDHGTLMAQVMTDLQSATENIPKSEHATEAKNLFEAMQPSTRRQQCGPRRLGEILPVVLAQLGVTEVELKSKGENDLT